MNLLPEVIAWHQAGATPIPVRADGTKAPAVKAWRQWEHAQPPLAELLDAFGQVDTDGLGLICGAASGNLEMIELEGRAVAEGWLQQLEEAFDAHGPQWRAVWDRIAAGYVEATPSGGIHWHYRVTDGPAAKNTKLASRPARPEDGTKARVVVMIETRGQGGFTVVAPSGGRTHKSRQAWTVLAGSRNSIPALTVEERDGVHAIASTLDLTPAEEWTTTAATPGSASTSAADDTRPGEEFNEAGSWQFLLDAGWQVAYRWPGGRIGWTRPGKNPRDGISATTDGAEDGRARLYVFSTSTEFEAERPYTRFGAYTRLAHGGDFAASARALRGGLVDGRRYGVDETEPSGPALTLLQGGQSHTPSPAPQPAAPWETQPVAAGAESMPVAVEQHAADALPHIIATSLTDAGNAKLFAARHGHRLRWVPARGQWLAWDGTRWRPCEDNGEARQAALDTIDAMRSDEKAVRDWQVKSRSRRAIDAMVDLATSIPTLRVRAEDLDAAPMVLNTPGGLVDLEDGTMRSSTPADLCTRSTSCAPDPSLPAPRWHQFLGDTFGGDLEMISFVQRLAGYSAWGQVTHHVLPFLHGPGGNGKSVFVDVLVELLGDYASTAPPAFLIAGREDESAIARLAGLRLVVSSEVNQGARFDEAKVKLLTGGDTLTARFLYGRHFTFRPSHTLWVTGNHQPRVEAGGESFWRRLRLIPFTYTVAEEKRIENLKSLLIDEEGPAILAWIVRGAIDVAAGLAEPADVKSATADYAAEEDHLGRFVEERLMLSGSGRERASDVRAAYAGWCRAEGEQAVSAQVFARELRSRWGIQSAKSNGVRQYVGATLYSDPDDPRSDPAGDPWSDR